MDKLDKLVVGHNYIGCFLGDDAAAKGFGMTYNGGDSWTARKPGTPDMTMDSPATTAKVIAYTSNSKMMGRMA